MCQPRPQSLASGESLRAGLGSGETSCRILHERFVARQLSSGRYPCPLGRLGAGPVTSAALRGSARERWACASGAPHPSAPRFGFVGLTVRLVHALPLGVLHLREKSHGAAVGLLFCFFLFPRKASACTARSSPSRAAETGTMVSRQLSDFSTGLAVIVAVNFASPLLLPMSGTPPAACCCGFSFEYRLCLARPLLAVPGPSCLRFPALGRGFDVPAPPSTLPTSRDLPGLLG